MGVESNAKIVADFTWKRKDGDCQPCRNCGDMMISAKYVLTVEMHVAGKKESAETKVAICAPCYEIMEIE